MAFPAGSDAGIILFAHGARDPRWAEPFERIAGRVRAAAPDLAIELAFLEFMTPDLATAARRLAEAGATEIRVVPLFFGRGSHLRIEVPRLVAQIATTMPDVRLELLPAAGDDDAIVEALAAFCLAAARR
jgi:sirohydrochlorin cobaltochelatase